MSSGFDSGEIGVEMNRIARKKYAQNSVTAITDLNFFLGENSIVNIGSEGEYESSL